ncbi:MAG: Phospho-N-acetylmuramoyl-pentapeptide-transferase [Candidatus Woesebacteria bacterium GW2011_GWA2_44_33]|uniref:Phospho-N-acetylmuramoyl-pentapeptide-transferase n=1 Tax=Candidatus Woesebacteria bacterium GW2011_GWA2_44_33 TaxID=1618564 RepID=A0A0G1J2E7_9BACT|nr:MAG: Phospho-N-acetylmuramoyl-pentapeptide-transferase [Candidatus Woesebacteria bacterium GW2011_GWA2_44_33]
MALVLGLLIVSFLLTAVLIVPFINLLYQLKFQRRRQKTKDPMEQPTPIYDRFHRSKTGTPVGGGLLVIVVTSILFSLILPLVKLLGVNVTSVFPLVDELNVLFFTFISFGLLGLYDDIMKFFGFEKTGFFGLRLRWKLGFQVVLAAISAILMYVNLGIDIFYIPFIGVFHLGWWFVPAAAFIIVSFGNAVNISDGLDGLAAGLLMVAIFALWVLSASILDTTLSMFLALWLGSTIAFLYFNVYPARIFLGDAAVVKKIA